MKSSQHTPKSTQNSLHQTKCASELSAASQMMDQQAPLPKTTHYGQVVKPPDRFQ